MHKGSGKSRRETQRIRQGYHREGGDNPSPSSLSGRDRAVRNGLYLKGYGYLKQDMRRYRKDAVVFAPIEKIEGQSSKLLVLKVTNCHKATMPYEHLTLKRIDSIL